MQIDSDDVRKIARLAMLAIEDDSVETYIEELSGILDLVDQLGAVDTQGVEPMAHPVEIVQRLRADVVTEDDKRDQLQSRAPRVEDGLYLVPQVIDPS